jgi:hypothetical protein
MGFWGLTIFLNDIYITNIKYIKYLQNIDYLCDPVPQSERWQRHTPRRSCGSNSSSSSSSVSYFECVLVAYNSDLQHLNIYALIVEALCC